MVCNMCVSGAQLALRQAVSICHTFKRFLNQTVDIFPQFRVRNVPHWCTFCINLRVQSNFVNLDVACTFIYFYFALSLQMRLFETSVFLGLTLNQSCFEFIDAATSEFQRADWIFSSVVINNSLVSRSFNRDYFLAYNCFLRWSLGDTVLELLPQMRINEMGWSVSGCIPLSALSNNLRLAILFLTSYSNYHPSS